jgi:carboxymethylenebutenolidase
MTATRTEWATVTSPDGPMRTFVARPEAPGTYPGLVVIQEAFGINDHIQEVCRRYAALGYVVVSPDLFHRQGVESIPYSEIAEAKKLIAALSDDQVVDDVFLAVEALRTDPSVDNARLGVVGYCFGGRCAYVAAGRLTGLRAVVVYYGGRIATGEVGAPVDRTGEISGSVLAHFGGQDASIPADQVDALDRALDEAGVDHLVVTYPEAGHGFACDARPANFEPAAAAEAWARTTAFLAAAFSDHPRPAQALVGVGGGNG